MSLEKAFTTLVKPLVGTGIGRIKPLANIYQKLAAKIMPYEKVIEVQGFKIKVVTEGHIGDISTELLFKGVHEPTSTDVFKRLIQESDCVIDVGANIGYFTMLSARLVGGLGRVWAFEPDPKNMSELSINEQLNNFTHVRAVQAAVSDYNGRSKLFLSSRESARHSLISSKEHDGSELVDVVKLDDVIPYMQIPVNFIKSDTEGNELAVLSGASQIINKNYGIKVLVEVFPEAMKHVGYTPVDLWSYITNDLSFKHIYLVDDYKKKVFSVTLRKLMQYLKSTGMPCNLLCAREKIGAFE